MPLPSRRALLTLQAGPPVLPAAGNAACCAYTQRTYPNGHALGDRVPTAFTGPSRPLLHMRLKAFAGPFGVMGMRTIRWRNGQCPGRNGQWAERIAHAGSEAVRLVPFSSLPAVILDYLLTEYCVSAWR